MKHAFEIAFEIATWAAIAVFVLAIAALIIGFMVILSQAISSPY